jgi:hypothetical protein
MRTGRTGQLKALNDASEVSLRLWPVVSNVTTGQPPNGAWYEHFRDRHRTVDALGTHMFLIAFGAGGLASWDVPSGGRKRERRIRKVLSLRSFLRRRHHEDAARIENALPDLYRQMDPQDFVFAERAASSTRGVAPPPRKRLAADAYQNSSQSRIHGIDLEARDGDEGHCGRVFLDQAGKDDHRSTRRHVPLGKAILQGGEC